MADWIIDPRSSIAAYHSGLPPIRCVYVWLKQMQG